MLDLEFLWKDAQSSGGNCPALYRTSTGDYVVQGWQLDDETRASLRDLADNETAVVVPANVIDRIKGTA